MSFYKYLLLFGAYFLVSAAHADEQTAQITFDRVEVRSLFGGLGESKAPMGTTTELFVREESAPLVYLDGDYTHIFQPNIPIRITSKWICTAEEKPECTKCDNCVNSQEKLDKYDEAKGAVGRKQLQYIVPLGAVSRQVNTEQMGRRYTRILSST